MNDHRHHTLFLVAEQIACCLVASLAFASGDFDGNGYVGLEDYLYFESCLST